MLDPPTLRKRKNRKVFFSLWTLTLIFSFALAREGFSYPTLDLAPPKASIIERLISGVLGIEQHHCDELLKTLPASRENLSQMAFDILKRFVMRLSLPEDRLIAQFAEHPGDPTLAGISSHGENEIRFLLADQLKSDDIAYAMTRSKFFNAVPVTRLFTGPDWILVARMVSARDQKDWDLAISIVEKEFPSHLQKISAMQTQLAFLLNRRNQGGDQERAEKILLQALNENGNRGEIYGLLGRIEKDRYEEAKKSGASVTEWTNHLIRAKNHYLNGFRAEPQNYYPGYNAIELLLEIGSDDALKEAKDLMPMLRFSIQSANQGHPIEDSDDYWLLATALQFAILDGDWNGADKLLNGALEAAEATWMLETSLSSIRRIARLPIFSNDLLRLKRITNLFTEQIKTQKIRHRSISYEYPKPYVSWPNTENRMDVTPVDLFKEAEKSGIANHLSALMANSAGVLTLQEYLVRQPLKKPIITVPQLPPEGYLLGLTEKGHRPVYEAIADFARLEKWWDAYHRHGLNGDQVGHIEKFMGKITGENQSKVVFLVPKNLFYSNIQLSHTAKEMAWILEDPKHRAPNVQFVFGAYDLYSPEFIEDLTVRRGYAQTIDLLGTILQGYQPMATKIERMRGNPEAQ